MVATTTEQKELNCQSFHSRPSLVLLSVTDHHARAVPRSSSKRIIGVLLGQDNGKTINVANSYGIPFEEDEKDSKTWFLDHNYIESMTAPKRGKRSSTYHQLSRQKKQRRSVLSICSAISKTQQQQHFHPSQRATFVSPRSTITAGDVQKYLVDVASGSMPVNHQIVYYLQDILNLLPDLSDPTLTSSVTTNTNDQLLVVYLSSLLRAVIALHALVDNKASIGRSELQDGGDDKEKEKKGAKSEKKGDKDDKTKESSTPEKK
ncbi:proteasome regulatory particle [Salix suchowensis]|nr:proteasome regulatory particle [Salix suchowensis]